MIPDKLLQELRYVELYTDKAVKNSLVGDTQSSMRGHGFDFIEHKRYQQGDDYRMVDWNVTARTLMPHVKLCYEEKEMTALVMADVSRSMEFGSHHLTKRELVIEAAATIAFSASRDNMNVGLLGFTDQVEFYLRPRKGRHYVWKILEELVEHRPLHSGTRVSAALEFAQRRLKRTSLVFLISDFITLEQLFDSPYLKTLVVHHDLVPIIVEDPLEQKLPPGRGFFKIRDVETRSEMVLSLSPRSRLQYQEAMGQRRETLSRMLYRLGLDHVFLKTGESSLNPLLRFFLMRKRKS
ncbi:MAG: DUF58 domain-containing protein [Acidobacteria bacterium]|nr:DUF58 domain-containing protein [Acidobacteriota bacterium]